MIKPYLGTKIQTSRKDVFIVQIIYKRGMEKNNLFVEWLKKSNSFQPLL